MSFLLQIINAVIIFGFDATLVYFWGWKPFVYLLGGSLLAMGK